MALTALRTAGPVHDGVPFTTGGYGAPDALSDLIGPTQIAPQFDRRGRLSQATRGIEEIYEGKVDYLGYTLSSMLFHTHNPDILSEIMPLVQKPDIYISWHSKTPDRTLIPQASESSLPTVVTGRREQQSAVMKRYRIGVVASIEGLKTDDGKADTADNLLNAGMSTRETMEMVALRAIIAAPLHYARIAEREEGTIPTVAEAVAAEIELFDGVRKRDRGADDITDEVRKKMSKENVQPTHLIIPEGMRSQVQSSVAKRDYYRNGPGASTIVDQGGASMGDTFGPGLRIIVSRAVYMYKSGKEVAPLRRPVTIGNYFVLRDRTLGLDAKAYKSDMRAVYPFDMDVPTGDYSRADVEDAVNNCGRWNPDGTLTQAHYDMADDAAEVVKRQRFALKDGYLDPLLYQVADKTYAVGQVLGQLERAAIPDRTMSATGDTLYERLMEAMAPGGDMTDVNALRAGTSLIETLYEKPLSAIDVTFMQQLTFAAGVGADGVLEGNTYGGPIVPTGVLPVELAGSVPAELPALAGLGPNYRPAGFGSAAGLLTLADIEARPASDGWRAAIAPEVLSVSRDFARATDRLWSAVRSLVPTSHTLLDGASLPAWLRSGGVTDSLAAKQDSLAVLLSNLGDAVKMPLYVRSGQNDVFDVLTADDLAAQLAPAGAPGEAELLVMVRQALSQDSIGELRTVFTDVDSINAFRREYTASDFGRAYAAREGGSADEADFAAFLLNELRAVIVAADVGGAGSSARDRLYSVLLRTVRSVRNEEPVPTGDFSRTVEAWASAAPAGQRAFEANPAAVGSEAVLTRLTAPVSRVNVDDVSGDINVASPADPSKYVTANARQSDLDAFRRDSRLDLEAATRFVGIGGGGLSGRRQALSSLNDQYSGVSVVGGAQRQFFTDVAERPVRGRRGQERQGVLALNQQLAARYNRVGNEVRDPLRRLAHQLVLLAPLHRDTLLKWSEKNVRIPFDFYGMRPLCRYVTEGMVYIKGGIDYGFMAFRETDVQVSHDAVSRGYLFNITTHFAPVILQPEYSHVQRDARVIKYGGGAGMVAITPENWDVEDPNPDLSVVYALCGAQSTSRAGPAKDALDITGAFHREVFGRRMASTTVAAMESQPLYDSAVFYNELYHFHRLHLLRGDDRYKFSVRQRVDNTFMLPVGQYNYKVSTGDYSQMDLNKDHFGPNIAPGHGTLRRTGLSKYYTDYKYERSYVPS